MNDRCLCNFLLGLLLSVGRVAAGIEFAKPSQALTAGHNDTEVAGEFGFTVTGDKPVKILEIKSYCSCLKAKTKDGRMEFKPGDTATIDTAFLVGSFEGEVSKHVVVTTDDANQKDINLTLTVTIPKVYEITPDQVTWNVGEAPTGKKVKFTVLNENAIHVTAVVSTRENMKAEAKEIKKGREYEITLTPTSTAEPMLGALRIETDAPFPRYQKRLMFFNVLKKRAGTPPVQNPLPTKP